MKTLCAALPAAVLAVGFVACSGHAPDPSSWPDSCFCDTTDGGAPGPDAETAEPDAGPSSLDATTSGLDATSQGVDAAVPGLDASEPVDAGALPGADAATPGLDASTSWLFDAGPGSNDPCTFNADCVAWERCECSETEGCACKAGPRGAGRSGVDTCLDGNDCDTALCVEGWPEGTFYCSGPCGGADAGTCVGVLPLCSNIAFIGKICVRDPSGG